MEALWKLILKIYFEPKLRAEVDWEW